MVNRRNFLGSMIAAGAVGLLAPRVGQAGESRIEVLVNEPIGKILPDIYSHFIEHLEARARVLSATDIHAHNSFTNPRGLEPRDEKVNVGSGQLVYQFQPASVTRLQLTLA